MNKFVERSGLNAINLSISLLSISNSTFLVGLISPELLYPLKLEIMIVEKRPIANTKSVYIANFNLLPLKIFISLFSFVF